MKSLPEKLDVLDITLSIYNQEKIIRKVLDGILKNTTTPFNLILLFDGCNRETRDKVFQFLNANFGLDNNLKKIVIGKTPDVRETLANNAVWKLSEEKYMIAIQDDVVVRELGWERRLTYPLRKYDDVFAVTSRGSQNFLPGDGSKEIYGDMIARERRNHPRNIFAIRDVINRGPIAFRMDCLKKLNFLNEKYAPCNLDDADLCLRAWREYKWKCGGFWIDYESRHDWGISHVVPDSINVLNKSIIKNTKNIYTDHADYINSKIKHNEDIVINDSDIDYIKKDDKQLETLRDIELEYWNHGPSPFADFKRKVENYFNKFDKEFKKTSRQYGIKRAFTDFIQKKHRD